MSLSHGICYQISPKTYNLSESERINHMIESPSSITAELLTAVFLLTSSSSSDIMVVAVLKYTEWTLTLAALTMGAWTGGWLVAASPPPALVMVDCTDGCNNDGRDARDGNGEVFEAPCVRCCCCAIAGGGVAGDGCGGRG